MRAPELRPLALYAKQANALVLTGVDARASALGLRAGMSLADARAIRPELVVIEAEPEADARALDAIAAWCERFTPVIVIDAPDGLFLDISGCGHLFGGEDALCEQIVARLAAQGFASRAALAPTPGAAWGLARFAQPCPAPPPADPQPATKNRGIASGPGAREALNSHPSPERCGASSPGPMNVDVCTQNAVSLPREDMLPREFMGPGLGAAHPSGNGWAYRNTPQGGGRALQHILAPLPIEALRLDQAAAALLKRLGLKTIGQLIAAPRTSFAARAGERGLLRLDQALGRAPEALTPRRPAPPVFALRRFLEPLFSVEAILEATQVLCADALIQLERRGAGVRRACLHLFGVDGRDRVIEIGASRPEREVKILLRLFREKLGIAAENLDAEFGIEAARLDIVALERIEDAPRALVGAEAAHASAEKLAAIVDVLSARLGAARVLRPKLNDTHAPERAGGWRKGLSAHPLLPTGCFAAGRQISRDRERSRGGGGLGAGDNVMRRPLTIFARAQMIDAIATVPDGPPIRFRWRRVLREVARAEGPERIAGDWLSGAPARDYYRVEDREGRRYWLYREGLYGEAAPPRWFVHGLFA